MPGRTDPGTSLSPAGNDATLPEEFTFIRRHFLPLAGPGALGLTDDAALLTPEAGRELAVAVDTMVEGVHFLPGDPPETVGRKLLRVNLSDMAAMNARAFGWLLTLSCPTDTSFGTSSGRYDDSWFAAFARGLAEDQKEFGVSLLGGDTTSTRGPLVLSLTILGTVQASGALRRNGARDGDGLWVTGTIGDGALGLRALAGEIADPTGWLAARYRLPQPRVGLDLGGVAHAAMDVSDGLVQDSGHLARESGLGVTLVLDDIPLSPAARALGDTEELRALCATGGDDYELLLAVPDEAASALQERCAARGLAVTRIGKFLASHRGVRVQRADGTAFPLTRQGWSHL